MTDEELAAVRARVHARSAGCVQRDEHVAADGNALLAEVDRLRHRVALLEQALDAAMEAVEAARQQRDAWQRLARQGVTWTGASSGDYRAARGVIPWREGDELPEETIRRAREEADEQPAGKRSQPAALDGGPAYLPPEQGGSR